MPAVNNLFEATPTTLPNEHVQPLHTMAGTTIERIVSRGHCSPDGFWYDQDWNEWVLLLRGSAGLEFEDAVEGVTLAPGDHIMIPAGTRHRVAWTDPQSDTVWLAVHIQTGADL